MKKEYFIPACSGMKIEVEKGEQTTVEDIESGQVVDFFAQKANDEMEFLSTGVTMRL